VVRITDSDVHSSFGLCTFVRKEFEGNALKAQMSCNGPAGNMLLGDVRFTVRADKNIDFVDQDHTYNVTLYPFPQTSAAQHQPPAAAAGEDAARAVSSGLSQLAPRSADARRGDRCDLRGAPRLGGARLALVAGDPQDSICRAHLDCEAREPVEHRRRHPAEAV